MLLQNTHTVTTASSVKNVWKRWLSGASSPVIFPSQFQARDIRGKERPTLYNERLRQPDPGLDALGILDLAQGSWIGTAVVGLIAALVLFVVVAAVALAGLL